jgi:hypothetical protein
VIRITSAIILITYHIYESKYKEDEMRKSVISFVISILFVASLHMQTIAGNGLPVTVHKRPEYQIIINYIWQGCCEVGVAKNDEGLGRSLNGTYLLGGDKRVS